MTDPISSGKIAEEASKLAPEVYKDLAKPAIQEVGSVAGRTVKALLFPIRGMLWGWEQIEKLVEEGVKKRLEKVPVERRKTPEPEIAVPLIQALTYTAQNETLREMYLNLLANSMDNSMEKIVHPSFVVLIKQMNSLDAKVFDKLSNTQRYQKIINPNISVANERKSFIGATPEWFIGWNVENYSYFDVSASFIRLSKFGLIELMYDRTAGKEDYHSIKSAKFLHEILQTFQHAYPDKQLEIEATNSLVYVNEFGMQFKKACK